MEKELVIKAYKEMLTSRRFEEKVAEMFKAKECKEKPLSGIGQEATSVGPVTLLKGTDYVIPSLRAKGAFFAKGWTFKEAFLELLRKEEAYSHGLWTSHHAANMEKGIVLSSAIVASSLSVGDGIAMAQKLRHTDNVVVAFFGDGTSSRADVHTSMNLAAARKLPIIFICENNMYAISTRIEEQMGQPDVYKRAEGYGMPGVKVDGQDIIKVMEVASEAIARARKGEGPTLIECKTYRYHGHTENHDHLDGRDEAEYNSWFERDPLKLAEKYMQENGIMSCEEIEKIGIEVDADLNASLEYAKNAKDADYSDVKKYVYAD